VVDQVQRGLAELGGVVGRDRGRHADGDAGGAVGQQVREGAGQDDGLLVLLIVGEAEIDRVLGDAGQKLGRDLRHARLGVAHGGGVIAVDIAEIALAVDERVAHGEPLREAAPARRRSTGRHAGGTCPSPRRRCGRIWQNPGRGSAAEPHGVHDAPVHGLQPVAHIGQRAVHDGRQRIGEIALLERLLQVDRFD
jgi:hypothetical protein